MISGSAGSGPAAAGGSIWSRWRDSFGETHLTLDAVVAHVDGELAPGPAQRAAEHAARCLLCAGEVAEQRRTRGRLRGADTPGASSALLSALRAIPDETLPPSSPAGVDPSPPDEDDRRDPAPRGRRIDARGRRRGLPVAVASGLALGSVVMAGVPALPAAAPIARSMVPGAAVPGRPQPGAPAALTVTPGAAPVTPVPAPGGSPTSAPAAPDPPVPGLPAGVVDR